MRSILGIIVAIAAAVGALAGCGSEAGRQDWADIGERWSDEIYPTVFEGDGYSVGTGSFESGSNSLACAQVIIADAPLDCVHGGGGLSTSHARIGDTRFIGVYAGADVERAIAWSSASSSGRDLDVVVAGPGVAVVWIMEPGEEPWGIQLVRADGTLAWSPSYVGLPGE